MKQISVITIMCLMASVGAWAETLKGKVIDQDAQPVVGATIECVHYMESDSILLASTVSDAEGNWELNYEFAWQGIKIEATKEGHTSYACYLDVSEKVLWPKFIFRLFNALNYQAGKRYTIILPVTPDALAGRYFRLDRVEGGNIIFERESSPQANIPYVFYPNKDFRIDLRDMDLSMEAGQTIISVTQEGVGSREAAYFIGSYSYINYSDILERDTPVYFDDDNNGYNYGRHAYHIDAMHATLLWNWHAFDSPFQPTYEAPSFVFHDPEEDIPTYRPFIEEGKVWKVGWFNFSDTAGGLEYHYFYGDTIVEGRVCKKMMCQYEYCTLWEMSSQRFKSRSEYVGALYEESGRVYYAKPNSEDLKLIYDFASSKGSVIECYRTEGDFMLPCTISSKQISQDATFHGKTTEVSLNISNEVIGIWREGVGYNCLQNFIDDTKTGLHQKLMSCTVGDEVLYHDDSLIDGVTPEEPSEVKKKWLDFTHTVKTRPKAPERGVKSEKSDDDLVAASEEETVTGEYSVKALFVNFTTLAGPYAITITDAAGQEVYRKVVQTSNVVALNTDISAYPKGSYTLTVENEEEVYAALLNINDENSLSPTLSPARDGSAGAVYNLSGQRLTVPRRGVNIIDGKKVAIK